MYIIPTKGGRMGSLLWVSFLIAVSLVLTRHIYVADSSNNRIMRFGSNCPNVSRSRSNGSSDREFPITAESNRVARMSTSENGGNYEV